MSTVDVFYESPLTRGTSFPLQCGAKCVALFPSCVAMEVCEDGVCRLWNGSFTGGIAGESSHTCRRYIKMPISVRTEETSIAMEDSSSNDQTTSSHLTTSSDDSTSSITASIDSNIHECQMKYVFSDGNVKAIPCVNNANSWIVIQRRFDGKVLFNRSWSEYENGFGSTPSEFWLGNQYISELTYAGYTILKIDLMSFSGEVREVEYNFHVENKINKYKLHVSERTSSGIDCLSASNLEMFSTFDQDNDKSKAKNCAVDMTSGWWFEHSTACTEGNLNGKRWSQEVNDKQGMVWTKWLGQRTLKESRMIVRKP